MFCLAARTYRFLHCARVIAAQKRRMIRMGGKLVFPSVFVGIRRALRRARTRLLAHQQHCEQPHLATLRTDKILGLFPDAILLSAAKSMTLRYFFPNEAIIFIGCEDDEAYVLASGSADVMMGSAKVFTMQPGMVFGTIGMISGEPRSASIFARGEGCMAWVMKRAVFDAAGDSAAVSAAHEALAEVRQKNIMNVYKSRLDPAALSAFPLFRGLANETLQALLVCATPRIVRRGNVLAEPDQPMSVVSHMILLKGRVAIKVSQTSAHLVPKGHALHGNEEKFSLAGELRNAIDAPQKLDGGKHPALIMAARMDPGATVRRGVRRASVTLLGLDDVTGSGEYHVSAPALLNVNPLLLPGGMMRPTPFVMTAATDCDLLCLSRKTLRTIDMLELATMQQNALNAHADFIGTQTKRDVVMMLLDNLTPMFSVMQSSQGVIATLRNATADSIIGSMKIEKWVYPRGGYMCFDRSNEFLVNIILEGEMEEMPGATPTSVSSSGFPVWPPLAEVWFAARDAVIRTTKRTVCLRVRRRDILAWFCRALPDPQDLRTVCSLFASNVSSVGGGSLACVMGFSTFDLDQVPCVLDDSANSQAPLESSRLVRRSSRTYSTPSDLSETTVAAVLRPVLQQISEQLNRLQQYHDGGKEPKKSSGPPTPVQGRAMSVRPSTGGHSSTATRTSSSASQSQKSLPASVVDTPGAGLPSPLFIGVSKSATYTAAGPAGSFPLAASTLLSPPGRRPSSAVNTPAPLAPGVARSPRSDNFREISRIDSGNSNSSTTHRASSFREVSKMDSSGSNSHSGGGYKGGGASPFREAGKMDSNSSNTSVMPPTSPQFNPSPRTVVSQSSSGHPRQRVHSSSVASPMNIVEAYLESKQPTKAQRSTQIKEATTTSVSERNLPVRHRVDLDALRGKSNRRGLSASKSN
jgi:CRP-like cAMP-binding protein